MYAIFEDGGKQYKVGQGDRLLVERRADRGDSREIRFEKVLFIGGEGQPRIGTPYVDGAAVTGTVVREMKTRKVVGIKHRRRKGFKKKWGHRQQMLEVTIGTLG